jgi:Flp pilus assembly protein TadG
MKPDMNRPSRRDERGAIIILMAIALVGLIGAGSLAVDLGSALVTKAELQNVADASSLAATRELGLIYKEQPPKTDYKEYTLTSTDESRIRYKALQFAAANKAGGVTITVGNSDVEPCTYSVSTGDTTCSSSRKGIRAIKVKGRRDDTQNGQIQTTLGRVLGINEISVAAQSTAAISAAGKLKPATADFPIGLDEAWFSSHSCASAQEIKLYPTDETSCAGWHTFQESASSAKELKDIIQDMIANKPVAPEITANETIFEFNNGQVESAMKRLVTLFNARGGAGWTVNVPVYKNMGCAGVNGPNLIVGFARVRLLEVRANPSSLVRAEVVCGVLDGDQAEGGGPNDFGTLVSTPGMIQ